MILKYEAIKVLEVKSATNLGVDKDLTPPQTLTIIKATRFLNRLEECISNAYLTTQTERFSPCECNNGNVKCGKRYLVMLNVRWPRVRAAAALRLGASAAFRVSGVDGTTEREPVSRRAQLVLWLRRSLSVLLSGGSLTSVEFWRGTLSNSSWHSVIKCCVVCYVLRLSRS